MSGEVSYQVELTEGAVHDLWAIADYLYDQDAGDAASKLLGAVDDLITLLERFPNRGSIPAELQQLGLVDFRQQLIRPYRLFYEVRARTVTIVLIADGRRDLRPLIAQRLSVR